MNKIIETLATDDGKGLKGQDESLAHNAPVRFMNVWPMSVKRPDAHMAPPKDCLHWCLVGVMNAWSQVGQTVLIQAGRLSSWKFTRQLLWHMIVDESRES